MDSKPVCLILAGPHAKAIEIHGKALVPEGMEWIGPQQFLGSPLGPSDKPKSPLLSGWEHEREKQEKMRRQESFVFQTHYMDRDKNQALIQGCKEHGYRIHLYYFGVRSLAEAYAMADNVRHIRGFPPLYQENIERGYLGGMRELNRDLSRLDRILFCATAQGGPRLLCVLDKEERVRLQSTHQERWYQQHFETTVNQYYPHKQLSDYIALSPDLALGKKLSI